MTRLIRTEPDMADRFMAHLLASEPLCGSKY